MKVKLDTDKFSHIILLFLFLCCFVLPLAASSTSGNNITSIYQLGDSISDTGNERLVPLPSSRQPYGETNPGYPTGRWSNGHLIIDYIAMYLGLPLLNPSSAIKASFVNGVNFAYGGCTTLDFTFYIARLIPTSPFPSLNVQLQQLKSYLSSKCSPARPGGCAKELNQSMVIVGEFGYNDIGIPFSAGRSIQEIRSYIPLVIQAILNATRNIRTASIKFQTVYDEDGCLKSLNDLATFQNDGLQRGLVALRREFPNAKLLYADYYNSFLSVLREASTLGFDTNNLFKPCCGDGAYNGAAQDPSFCGNSVAHVCSDPNAYIHWDGIHPTQATYSRMFEILINDLGIKPS